MSPASSFDISNEQTNLNLLISSGPPDRTNTNRDPITVTEPRTPQDPSCGLLPNNGLVALVPKINQAQYTASQNPKLLFYVGYPINKIEKAEFIINDFSRSNEQVDIYINSPISLQNTFGIVEITARPENGLAFEKDVSYRWIFKLYLKCDDLQGSEIKTVSGGLRYDNSENRNYWFDSFADIAEQISSNSSSPQIQNQWLNSLTQIGESDLYNARIIERH